MSSMIFRFFWTKNFGTARILQSKAVSQSYAHRKVKRKATRKSEQYAFSDEFEQKMSNWKQLIRLEIKEESLVRGSSENAHLLEKCEFSFKDIKHSLRGPKLSLEFCAKMGKDQFVKISSLLRPGSPLVVFCGQSDVGIQATASELDANSIVLFLKKIPTGLQLENSNEKFRLGLGDSSTLFHVLDLLSDRKSWLEYPGYKSLLYTYRAVALPTMSSDPRISEFNPKLNDDQLLAVRAALNPDRPITAIHGPPGTGKTKVIAEIVAQLVSRNKKVLVCAPSHKAVSNVLMNCYERGLRKYCKVYGEESEISNNFHNIIDSRDLDNIYKMMDGLSEEKDAKKLDQLRKQARDKQLKMCQQIAGDIEVIFCTMTSLSAEKVFDSIGFKPDIVIIDEAGQAMECVTWLMLFKAKRLVVVGDHNQLPAVVHSKEALKGGLGVSLIEWISEQFSSNVNFPLKVQYRFNNTIQSWPNAQFYGGVLKANPSVSHIHLKQILKQNENDEVLAPIVDGPLVLVNTDLYSAEDRQVLSELFQIECGADLFHEQFLNPSTYNTGEAMICAMHLKSLQRRLLLPPHIGCITPYLAQVHCIKSYLPIDMANSLDISSVDAFQGQEREAIVMSFVRNNLSAEIGFMREFRRLNVAVTRAKRQFLLIASSEMLKSDPTLKNLLEIIKLNGEIVPPSKIISASLSDMHRMRM